jgi:hypothetical protein
MLQEPTSILILTAKMLQGAESPYPQGAYQRHYGSPAHPPLKNQFAQGGEPPSESIRSLSHTPSHPPAARGAFVGRSHWQRQSKISWQWIRQTSLIRHELTSVITGLLSRKTYLEA